MESSLRENRSKTATLAYGGVLAAEKSLRALAGHKLKKGAMMDADLGAAAFRAEAADWPMSRISRWLKSHTRVDEIVAARRRNYAALSDAFSSMKHVISLYPQMPDGVCPWVYPVVFPDISNALQRLRQQGIPAVAWNGVRHPGVPASFDDAEFLYENLIFLPIHQSLTSSDLSSIIAKVGELSG